jgi:rod shape-determining protein MreC
LKRQNWIIVGLLVLGWIVFLGQPIAATAKLRMVFVRFCTPFVRLGDYVPVIRSRRELAQENARLHAENDRLRQLERALTETVAENQRLQQLLRLSGHVSPRTIGARVIGRDASNWWKTIQLDRGSDDGVRTNCPVLNADGLVGKVISVTRGESRVLLLLDPNCKVSGLLLLQKTREPGIVAGSVAAFGRDPRCLMTFVDRNAKIAAGQAVITSGLGSVFPKGILIGTVTGARLNQQTGMYQDVDVKPAVDFTRLEEVVVVLGQG